MISLRPNGSQSEELLPQGALKQYRLDLVAGLDWYHSTMPFDWLGRPDLKLSPS